MKQKHTYKTLQQSTLGFVSYCESCGEIQVNAGNLFLHLPTKDFIQFTRSLQRLEKKKDCEHIYCEENVFIKTPAKNLWLTFSDQEFKTLIDMLNMSVLLLSAEYILRT